MITSLIERLNKCREYVYSPCSDPRKVDDLLKEAADTIEALSEKCRGEHGEWEEHIVRDQLEIYCTNCGRSPGVYYQYEYCPSCGANMRPPEEVKE